MESLAQENGDAKIMKQAKAEAKLAAQQAMMADKLGAGEVTSKAKEADDAWSEPCRLARLVKL